MTHFSDTNDKKSREGFESPLGYHGVDVEGVEIGDSPTADTMMRGMPDYSASTGSLGSGVRPVGAKQMTVTSPPSGWSGTSWTGGLAQGCAPALKISASVNDIPSSGVCVLYRFYISNIQVFKKKCESKGVDRVWS